ncbi:MAG: hypothetical protein ABIR52_14730 [Casimicrobiaceae bacterium]
MQMRQQAGRSKRARGFLAALAAVAATSAAFSAVAGGYYPSGALVSVDVYDRNDGTSLPVYTKDGRRYVVGAPGHEYALRIRNCTSERILAVASVDGVNVVTGETAAPDQSGYVIDAGSSVEIAGWRKSLDRTAAFYFTDLGDSYAARTGRPGNVGVIGVAVFLEKKAPVAYRWRRDRIASNEAPLERDAAGNALPDAPMAAAPSTFGAARGDAPMARQEATADSARAVAKSALGAAAPLGTGHGRNENSFAQRVAFERASTLAAENVVIQYDRRDNLIAMGVLPGPRYAQRHPDPFPALRFAPDPR